jgi:hypothetical protein
LKKLRASHVEQLSLALDPAPAASLPPPSRSPDPRARRALAGTDVIEYRLRRARRRTIGFQIDDDGLTISAPRWVTVREIEAAIAEKSRWIRAKRREWHEWREKRRLPQVVFADGAVLPYLGGLAGFFLLVSAISNTISMYRHLQAGKPVNALILRQIMGGILLLVFGRNVYISPDLSGVSKSSSGVVPPSTI